MGDDDIDEGCSSLSAVARTYSLPECVAIVSMLRGYGIPATAHPWEAATVNARLMVAIGGMRIFVPDVHFADAQALLWAAEPYEPYFAGDWSDTRWINIFFAVLFFILAGFVPPPRVRLEIAGRPPYQQPVADGPEPNPA